MLVTLTSASSARTASEAYQLCKTEADAAVGAIESLKINNISIRRSPFRFSVPSGTLFLGPERREQVADLEVHQTIDVVVPEISKLDRSVLPEIACRIFDAAQTVRTRPGMRQPTGFGGEGLFYPTMYILSDSAPLKDKAVKAALARASQLKELVEETGIRVGGLKEVRLEGDGHGYDVWAASGSMIMPLRRGLIGSSDPGEVAVVCNVTVVYEIPGQSPVDDAETNGSATK
jgi:hypothetical protein